VEAVAGASLTVYSTSAASAGSVVEASLSINVKAWDWYGLGFTVGQKVMIFWNERSNRWYVTQMQGQWIIGGTLAGSLSSGGSCSCNVSYARNCASPGSTVTVYDEDEAFGGTSGCPISSGAKYKACYDFVSAQWYFFLDRMLRWGSAGAAVRRVHRKAASCVSYPSRETESTRTATNAMKRVMLKPSFRWVDPSEISQSPWPSSRC